MSLILEALRKSEAERRRGLPPDLHAELPPAPPPRTRLRAAAPLIISAFLLAVLSAWLLRPRQDQVTAAAPPAIVAEDSTAAPRPDAGTPSAPQKAPTAQTPADPTVAALPARTPQPTAAQAPATEQPTGQERAPAPPRLVSDGPIKAPPAIDAASAPPATARPPQADPQTTTAADADDGSTPADQPLALSDLDPSTRKGLPPLKLSMHLWHEQPSRRFVIIDGQRLGEGDRIGDASIVRIEREGVLLEWQGRLIDIPMR